MKPDEKLNAQNAIHAEATSILDRLMPGANLEADGSVPPVGDFEEATEELAEWVRVHGSAEGFVYSKSQTM